MLTSPIRLTVQRPSQTTVSFTVSNAPLRSTPSAYAHIALAIFARISIGLFTLTSLAIKANWNLPIVDILGQQQPVETDRGYASLKIFHSVAASISWPLFLPLACIVSYLCFRRFSTEESLLVLRTLGIQTSTSSSTHLSTSTTRFIPTSQIQDIFIHEAFKGFEVRYYLAVVVKGEADVVVVFPNLLPRRDIVERVWRGARACLFESKA